MRDSESYLVAFDAFQRAQGIYFDARRKYQTNCDGFERARQEYLVTAARVAVIGKKLGIKPLGGFAPALLPPLEVTS